MAKTAQNSKSYRVPPQNIESEKALLGAIMMRPGAIYEIVDIVTPHSFYSEKHKLVFEIMLELVGKSEPIDFLTMSSRLKEKGLLESIGGSVYLTELVNYVPSSANIRQDRKSTRLNSSHMSI